MKSLNHMLFWVSNFACLPAFISAEGNLRGSQGTEKNPKLQMDRMLKVVGTDDRIKIDIQSEPLLLWAWFIVQRMKDSAQALWLAEI